MWIYSNCIAQNTVHFKQNLRPLAVLIYASFSSSNVDDTHRQVDCLNIDHIFADFNGNFFGYIHFLV